MDLVLEFLELLLPPGWKAVLHEYPDFLEFFLGLLAVGLIYVGLVRRVWRGGGNGNGWDAGDGNGGGNGGE